MVFRAKLQIQLNKAMEDRSGSAMLIMDAMEIGKIFDAELQIQLNRDHEGKNNANLRLFRQLHFLLKLSFPSEQPLIIY
jgi:hypothetical protein